jgi:hypothetical protein
MGKMKAVPYSRQKISNYFSQNKKVHNTVFLRKIPNKLRNKSRDLFGIFLKNTVL